MESQPLLSGGPSVTRASLKVLLVGATGTLGRCILTSLRGVGHTVTVFVRSQKKLEQMANLAAHDGLTEVGVVEGQATSAEDVDKAMKEGSFDVLINTAGTPKKTVRTVEDAKCTDFCKIVDNLVTSAVKHGPKRVVFVAGFAALDIPGLDEQLVEYLPAAMQTYQTHICNLIKLEQSGLDWTLYCPGPMIEDKPSELNELTITLDTVPHMEEYSSWMLCMPLKICCLFIPIKLSLMPKMCITYDDLSNVMVAMCAPNGPHKNKRVGVANPPGFTRSMDTWVDNSQS